MTFWGAEVKPGKVTPFVPPPEASKLHLSQACLAVAAGGAKNGGAARAALRVKVGDGEPLLLAVLREGGTECLGLDLLFDQYAEFSVEGGAAVHLTGYYMPEYELGECGAGVRGWGLGRERRAGDADGGRPRAGIQERGWRAWQLGGGSRRLAGCHRGGWPFGPNHAPCHHHHHPQATRRRRRRIATTTWT